MLKFRLKPLRVFAENVLESVNACTIRSLITFTYSPNYSEEFSQLK